MDEVLAALPRFLGRGGHVSGEVLCLAVQGHLALGQRDEAWRSGLRADLAGVPFWTRPLIQAFLARRPGIRNSEEIAHCRRLLRRAPQSVRLHHRLALLHHRAGDLPKAWEAMEACLPLAFEDPLVLEDLMRTALGDLEALQGETAAERTTLARLNRLWRGALALLSQRHGDPHLQWDRATPALHLLRSGDALGALCLVRPVPSELRDQPLWEVEAMALRGLGQTEAARPIVEAGLEAHPTSYRLWLERHHLDLVAGAPEAAREALDMAFQCLPPSATHPAPTWEWHLRRAALAYFVDQDPEKAWNHLEQRPPDAPDDHHPPLSLQVRLALGATEEVYATLRPLLTQHPEDLELGLMEVECLAGLGAWESLAEHLEDLPAEAHKRPAYWHLKGIAAAHLQALGPALEALERAAQMAPGDLRLVLDAGHACMDLAEHARAEIHWRQALRIDPTCAEALVNLAETLHLRHDPEGAKRLLRECLLHHPDHGDAQTFLAELEAN